MYSQMKKFILQTSLLVLSVNLLTVAVYAQCEANETTVEMTIYTDPWGYETYWEIVPYGNGCGNGTIAWGGNDVSVGCDGAGEQNAEAGGYDNNTVYQSGEICLVTGQQYDLVFIDDWGDGGLTFEVYENGLLTHLYIGAGQGDTWTFEAGAEPSFPVYDSPCGAELLEVDGTAVSLDNTEAISLVTEPRPAGGNCQLFGQWCEGGLARSVWATFQAPESGAVLISTCNEGTDFDTQIALYRFVECGNYDTYELISANDDKQDGCEGANAYASAMYASCLIPGEFYLIQLDGYYGESGNVAVSVSSWEGGVTLDAFVDNVDCPNVKGDNTGGISLNAYGTGLEYSVIWSGPNGFSETGAQITGLEQGNYSAIILTSCGEMASGTFTVSVPEPLSLNLSLNEPSCQTSNDGSASISASGATEPYTFFWQGPGGFEATGESVSDISAGNYTVTINDDNGCEFNQNVQVDYEELFTFSLGADTTICSNQQILVSAPAGLNYEWQDGSENQFFVVSGPEDGAGTYVLVLTASDDLGCEHTDAIIVTVSTCVGIEENVFADFKVYPNPSSEFVTLSGLPAMTNANLDLTDLSGRLIQSFELGTLVNGSVILDLSFMSSGLYLANLSSEQAELSFKLIVE